MAMAKLPTNFIDAQTTQQKYKVTDVGNNEALFEDVSEYSQDGSYFGANEINDQHQAINDLITAEEYNAKVIADYISGAKSVGNVTSANEALSASTTDLATTTPSATTAEVADNVTSATTADLATSTPTVDLATRAEKANRLVGAKINGTTFNGGSNITITDDSRLPSSKSFILASKTTLTFTDKVCMISDNRITATSLAEVNFTQDTIDEAKRCIPSVETSAGKVTIRVGRTPISDIKATIFIRVVE